MSLDHDNKQWRPSSSAQLLLTGQAKTFVFSEATSGGICLQTAPIDHFQEHQQQEHIIVLQTTVKVPTSGEKDPLFCLKMTEEGGNSVEKNTGQKETKAQQLKAANAALVAFVPSQKESCDGNPNDVLGQGHCLGLIPSLANTIVHADILNQYRLIDKEADMSKLLSKRYVHFSSYYMFRSTVFIYFQNFRMPTMPILECVHKFGMSVGRKLPSGRLCVQVLYSSSY